MRKKDKNGNIIIKLTEEQYYWLLRYFNREWDAEVDYRIDEGAGDTSYLEDLFGIYKALLGTPTCGFAQKIDDDDLQDKLDDMEAIKNEKENH